MVNIFKKFTDSQRLEACQICRGVARGPSPPQTNARGVLMEDVVDVDPRDLNGGGAD